MGRLDGATSMPHPPESDINRSTPMQHATQHPQWWGLE